MLDICQTLSNRIGYCWFKKNQLNATSKKFWPHCFASLSSVQSIIVAKWEGTGQYLIYEYCFFLLRKSRQNTGETTIETRIGNDSWDWQKKIYLIPWDSQKNKNDTIFFFWISNAGVQQTFAKTSTFFCKILLQVGKQHDTPLII